MIRRALLALALLFGPVEARAQLFSPGKLARPHAGLEGVSTCTKCHQAGKKLSAQLCLDCHVELDVRVRAKTGYHGRLGAELERCERCHHDHQGLDYAMIVWKPKTFDHALSGWSLTGAHRELDCARCHEPRLIRDARIHELLARTPKKETYLGLATTCTSCHFDEHRGQEGDDCARCHDTARWRPAHSFDHQQTAYSLRGAHLKVACEKCHPREDDRTTVASTFPAPKERTFARYRPVVHEACSSCHADPHDGRLGADCSRCHVEESWKSVPAALTATPSFHDQTRYPLVGAHRSVACRACHLPLGAKSEVFKNMRFAQCEDCHLDAHQNQVGARCENCHALEAATSDFLPARFSIEAHRATPYPLEGAHLAVACSRCHVQSEALAPQRPKALVRALAERKRTPPVSLAALDLPNTACRACHEDVHRGQFELRAGAVSTARACESCHRVESFSRLSFDHARDSRFALNGAHAQTACASCHRADAAGTILYRPLDTTCASCHLDVHARQLGADCARCHDESNFKAPRFGLREHAATRFPLTGKHAELECATCHASITAGGRTLRRYRSLPLECSGCHADFHRGAFDGYDP